MTIINLEQLPAKIKEDFFKPLRHLLPNPKTHSEETAGGRVLNELQKIIPWDEMLSTTHLRDLFANPDVQGVDRDKVVEALRICYELRKEHAAEIAAQNDYHKKLQAIAKYRQIHCIDAAYLTCHALKEQGFPTYYVDLIDANDKRFEQYTSHHTVTLYSEDKDMTLDDMFANLTHPDVRVVDYWMNEQDNACKMLGLINTKMLKTEPTLICSINPGKLNQELDLNKKYVVEPDYTQGYELFPMMSARAYELLFRPTTNMNAKTQFPNHHLHTRSVKR